MLADVLVQLAERYWFSSLPMNFDWRSTRYGPRQGRTRIVRDVNLRCAITEVTHRLLADAAHAGTTIAYLGGASLISHASGCKTLCHAQIAQLIVHIGQFGTRTRRKLVGGG